jgi:KDO2-lipid IV(A) lauroyltransferase
MKGILFHLVYSFLWLLTLLPLRVIYLLSDFLFFILYYLIGYRKKTVFKNLSRSLPDKSYEEIRWIAKTFYRQLTDYFLEWMYRIHMGGRELEKRMQFKNPDILQEYYKKGKSIMLLLSHYGNWEWPTRIPIYSDHITLAVYKPLENKYFDNLFIKLRGKFGAVGVPMESILRSIIQHQQVQQPVIVFTLADQRPQWRSLKHWTRFLNQDTPVITGPEKISRKFGMATIFLSISRVKRGYYEAEFRVISEDPLQESEFGITRKYLLILESIIKARPELYLWTHKRWKYHRNESKYPVDIGP